MSILRRMVLREFLGVFVLSVLSLTGLFVIVDFFDRVQRYSGEWGAPVTLLLKYMLCKVPQIIYDMTPLALPLSALVALGFLSRHRELVAIRAGGISARSVLIPVFLFALSCAAGLFAVGEYLAPESNKQLKITYRQIRRYRLSQKAALTGGNTREAFEAFGGWYRGAVGLYYIGRYDIEEDKILDFTILKVGRQFKVNQRIDAMQVTWSGNQWIGQRVIVRNFMPDGTIKTNSRPSDIINIPEGPRDFQSLKVDPHEMGFFELKDYIERLEAGGSDMREFRVDLWAKLSYPLAGLILLVLVVPLGLREGRGTSLSVGILLALVICFSFYEFHAWMLSIGHGGMVSPKVAAWTADALFGLVGIMAYSRST